ncbi:MAG: D-glycerate dehydrogenase [Planctomycetota bacterium]
MTSPERMPSRVFVTRRIPEPGLTLLRDAGVSVAVAQSNEEAGVPRDDLLRGVRDADVLLTLLTESIDREALAANPRLLGVASMAVGYDNVDVGAATELGLPVSNTPGVLTETTADLAFTLLLAVARHVPQAHRYLVEGRYQIWGPNLFLGADVGPGPDGRRKVLGIIGYGRIGRAMARRASGFDMEVIAHHPRPWSTPSNVEPAAQWAALDELLARSDFVSLHVPLGPATHHLIGAAELERMKPTAYLINTARGPVVDEAALVQALRARTIAGAALDVFEAEPALAPGLAELDNAVLLPHIASASVDTRGAMARMAAENALCHLRGAPAPNAVNPEVYGTAAYRARRGA